LTHRQQFYFWKNYRNNRLKHILPRPLPEPSAALPGPASTQPQPPVHALPPVPATSVAVTTSSSQAPSPMPYGIPPGSGSAKNDMRNTSADRRKRK
jgi:mediator of RNA polymerase II transcription subunit 31